MDMVNIKTIAEFGILVTIAYTYIRSNKKRDEYLKKIEEEREKQAQIIVNSAIEKILGETKISTYENTGEVLITQLKEYESKNIREHNELKALLTKYDKNFDDIKNGMADLYAIYKKGEDISTKNKQYRGVIRAKIGDVLPFFPNEKLRFYIVEQCVEFGDWIMDSMTYMFNSEEELNLAMEKLKTHCAKMARKCEGDFSEEVCQKYLQFKQKKLDDYMEKVKSMIDGSINDKVNRFFNLSILFMQDISSDILNAWASSNEKEPSQILTMDGLDELRRIEKRLNKVLIDEPVIEE